jgi:DNA mismatch endonuclease (patch repair protein)
MDDRLSPRERSALMARIRGKNTKPELLVRSALHRRGYRFRVHGSGLPGRPDLVFSSRRKVVFVHGCFWHYHPQCPRSFTPKTRTDFWSAKLARNSDRDRKVLQALRQGGWEPLVIWECELRTLDLTVERIATFLGSPVWID